MVYKTGDLLCKAKCPPAEDSVGINWKKKTFVANISSKRCLFSLNAIMASSSFMHLGRR